MKKKKIWKVVGLFALSLIVVGSSVGITWAAIAGSVGASFNVTYTARNVHAIISGEYVVGNGDGTGKATSLGEDLTFSGGEPTGTELKFPTPSEFVLKTEDAYVEFHYTIKNTSATDGFGVKLTLSGFDTTSNLQVNYSSSTRTTTEGTTAQYHCTRSTLSNLYVNPQGNIKSVLDIGIRISLINPIKNATGTGECTIFLDSLAERPIGELFEESSKTFDAYSMNKILQQISGDSNVNVSNMTAIDTLAKNKATSADMIANYNIVKSTSASAADYSVSAQSYDAEILIELGGLIWTPVYLSQDDQENDILTLWLVDNQQDVWSSRKANEGDYYGFIDGALYSDWSANWIQDSPTITEKYSSQMYGTSYIRAVTLNCGGDYATSGTEKATATQSDSNPFALFTMSKFGLTEYLITPEHVSWQESGQGDYPNENWGDAPATEESNAWKADYLWLPSLSETWQNNTSSGIWQTSTAQIALSKTSVSGEVGITNGDNALQASWLRSGSENDVRCVSRLSADGSRSDTSFVRLSFAVRPALHLNLTDAAAHAV